MAPKGGRSKHAQSPAASFLTPSHTKHTTPPHIINSSHGARGCRRRSHRKEHPRSVTMLAVACASILGMVPVAPTTQRVSLREELLTLLPAGPPHSIEGRAEELVRELELLENVPATPDFLLFGLSGAGARANVPTDHASGR